MAKTRLKWKTGDIIVSKALPPRDSDVEEQIQIARIRLEEEEKT